jgi:hypothetical protein
MRSNRDDSTRKTSKLVFQVRQRSKDGHLSSDSASVVDWQAHVQKLTGYSRLLNVLDADCFPREAKECVVLGAPSSDNFSRLQAIWEPFRQYITKVTFVRTPDGERDLNICMSEKITPCSVILVEFLSEEACLSFSKSYSFTVIAHPPDVGPSSCGESDESHARISAVNNPTLPDQNSGVIIALPVHSVIFVDTDITLGLPSTELPTCTTCLRRIQGRVTCIEDVDKYPITNRSFQRSSSCSVCDLFWRSSSTLSVGTESEQALSVASTPSVLDVKGSSVAIISERLDLCALSVSYPQIEKLSRGCAVCSLRQNLWVCLLCGNQGCGRYSAPHAQQHFSSSGHNFSLELATGRLWDYNSDDFVHFESDPVTLRSKQTSSGFCLSNPSTFSEKNVFHGGVSLFGLPLLNHKDGMSYWQDRLLADDDTAVLDSLTQEKINALIRYYENLLTSQIDDQRLFFEKRLARATVEAFECSGVTIGCENADAGMDEIAAMKIDISSLEQVYQNTLRETCEVEELLRAHRKDVDAIVAQVRQRRTEEKDNLIYLEQMKTRNKSHELELEQQLTDLRFYVRTQASVQASPLKAEIEGGGLVVMDGPNSSDISGKKGNKQGKYAGGINNKRR